MPETDALKERAAEILAATPHSAYNVQWPDNATRVEAFGVYKAMTGRSLKPNCPTCHFTVINHFRELQGMPPIQDVAPQRLAARRLAICKGQNEDGSDRCEHLAWPGLNCGLCLCFVSLKAQLKNQRCPAGKW